MHEKIKEVKMRVFINKNLKTILYKTTLQNKTHPKGFNFVLRSSLDKP